MFGFGPGSVIWNTVKHSDPIRSWKFEGFFSNPNSSTSVRCVASGGLGRLAQLHPQLINNLAQISFEKIKEPKSSDSVKSGFCLVLGDLHRYVGTRAKSSHIKTTGSILLSIACDNRLGVVQCWSTFALYLVVDAVGPNFTSFIEPTMDCVLDQLLASSQTVQVGVFEMFDNILSP